MQVDVLALVVTVGGTTRAMLRMRKLKQEPLRARAAL